jgi:phage terminase large subunit-like protein
MYSPGGRRSGQDKISRANAVAPLLESGMIWYPDGLDWALEMVEECASFPNGNNDDQVDSAVMAWTRFRQGNFISLSTDAVDEEHPESAALEYY